MLAINKYKIEELKELSEYLDDSCEELSTFQNFKELLVYNSPRYINLLGDVKRLQGELDIVRYPSFDQVTYAILDDLIVVYTLELALDDIPKYINSGSLLVRQVCKWRLSKNI